MWDFAVSSLSSVNRVNGWPGIWRWSLRNNRKKNEAKNLLGTLDLVYVWSTTEARVHCKISRSVQITCMTQEGSKASASEKCLTSPVGSRRPKSSRFKTLPLVAPALASPFRNLQMRPASSRWSVPGCSLHFCLCLAL